MTKVTGAPQARRAKSPHTTSQMPKRPTPAGRIPRARGIALARASATGLVRRVRAEWQHLDRRILGYLFAVSGTAFITVAITILRQRMHVADTPALYLVLTIWLSLAFSVGPAIVAASLSFMIYDLAFGPPAQHLTVWFVVVVALLLALEFGKQTSRQLHTILNESFAVRAGVLENTRAEQLQAAQALQTLAHETHDVSDIMQELASVAREGWEHSRKLLDLLRTIVATHDSKALLDALADRVVDTFSDAGVLGCALLLPDSSRGRIATSALRYRTRRAIPALSVGRPSSTPEYSAAAHYAFERGQPYGIAVDDERSRRADLSHHGPLDVMYVPLISADRVLGVLAIVGTPTISGLPYGAPLPEGEGPFSDWIRSRRGQHADLFRAFCDQIALALVRAKEQRDQFAHMEQFLCVLISHQLLSPVSQLRADAELLLSGAASGNKVDTHAGAQSILEASEQLERLVHNLVTLGKLSVDPHSLERGDWYPNEIIEQVLRRGDVRKLTVERVVQVDAPPDLPFIQVDHNMVAEMLSNLISNALKYSPPLAPVRIVVRAVPQADMLEIRIIDQGIGIPREQQPLLFTRFHKVDLSYAKPERLGGHGRPRQNGVGLSACRVIARAHGGDIRLESTIHCGTTVTVTLPIHAEGPLQGESPVLGARRMLSEGFPSMVGEGDIL